MARFEVGQKVLLHTSEEGETQGVVKGVYSLSVARRLRLIKGMHGKSGTILTIETVGGATVNKHQSTVKEAEWPSV